MKINPAILKYHAENQPDKIFDTEALAGKLRHVKAVEKLGMAIAKAENAPVNEKMLSICLTHHDDGRVNQMYWLGKFEDNEISHNVLGVDRFDRFLQVEKPCATDGYGVDILRNVMLYHGRMELLTGVSPEIALYVRLVTAADDFENAYSCVSYLVKEIEDDEKGYIKENPEADQKEVSNYVFEHFRLGEKFDKMKYCHTYAEYVIFAATLATNCIKNYGDIAKTALRQPGYGYSTILEGFKDVFNKTLTPTMAKKAYRILSEMVG